VAVGGQAWVEDVGVTYQAPACAVSKRGSDTASDVYRPANPPPGPLPVVVYVHGGAFTGGVRTASDNEVIAEELATLGYVTYNIDYCLAAPTAHLLCGRLSGAGSRCRGRRARPEQARV
jgi:acetyl esterase/lipase